MWRLWSSKVECGIQIFFDLFWSGVDFWSIMAKNPWTKMGVNLQILSVLACWVFFCFLWCLWMGSSLVLLVVLRFLIFPVPVVSCDWSCLLLLLGVLIKNCVRSVTVLNLQVKMEDSPAISWSFLVWFWLGNMLPRFSELWWDFDSCEMKIRIRISSIFFDLALVWEVSWPRILYQDENQDSLFVVLLGLACLLRLVNWSFASLVSYFPVLFIILDL